MAGEGGDERREGVWVVEARVGKMKRRSRRNIRLDQTKTRTSKLSKVDEVGETAASPKRGEDALIREAKCPFEDDEADPRR